VVIVFSVCFYLLGRLPGLLCTDVYALVFMGAVSVFQYVLGTAAAMRLVLFFKLGARIVSL